jgi:hypothetical protein
VFEEQSDFELQPQRVQAALERLERSAVAGGAEVCLLGTLHGIAIASPEVELRAGLVLARQDALRGLPPTLTAAETEGAARPVLVLHAAEEEDAQAGLARAREAFAELLQALRLFGEGAVALGSLAWSRVGAGTWQPLALGKGASARGMMVLAAEQEDELRAFCNLVERRARRHGSLSWALRRFEMGCERDSEAEALSDYLLALRALLEPEGPASGVRPDRLAALCADPDSRAELARRAVAAAELERAAMAGEGVKTKEARALSQELSTHLRALLSDVIAGHLAPDLVAVADALLRAPAEQDAASASDAGEEAVTGGEAAGRILEKQGSPS